MMWYTHHMYLPQDKLYLAQGPMEYVSIWLHNLCLPGVPMVGRNQPKKEWMWWK